jgi:transposase-like protein
MYSDLKKAACKRAYVVDNKQVSQIAAEYDVPERTLWNWKKAALAKGDDWDRDRTMHALGGGGEEQLVNAIVPMLMRFIRSIMEKIEKDPDMSPLMATELLAKLTDSLTKSTSALRRLNPGMDKLAMGVEFLNLLTKFIATQFPQHADAMQEVLEPFGKALLAHLES